VWHICSLAQFPSKISQLPSHTPPLFKFLGSEGKQRKGMMDK